MTQPYEVVHASKLFQEWMTALKERASLVTHNQSQAMFRGVLHAMRRHMPAEAVLAFGDALPPLPRGILIEGWRPSDPMPLASAGDLVRTVQHDLAAHHAPPDSIVGDVLAVIAGHLDPVPAATAAAQLPDALRPLWP